MATPTGRGRAWLDLEGSGIGQAIDTNEAAGDRCRGYRRVDARCLRVEPAQRLNNRSRDVLVREQSCHGGLRRPVLADLIVDLARCART